MGSACSRSAPCIHLPFCLHLIVLPPFLKPLQVVIQPSQAAVDTTYGTGTFRASQPALQIDQALLSGGGAGSAVADAAAAPAIATQSPTQPISLQGPLTANTVTASTLQTTAGGALMSGAAVVAGSLQTTGAAAVLSGGSLTCSLVTAEVLQTTDASAPPEQPANGTAGGAPQQQRGVTISGGLVSAAALQGDTVSSTGALQAASLDVGSGSITGGSLSTQRITATGGTVTAGTLLAQNLAVSQKLTAADMTLKGDAMCEYNGRWVGGWACEIVGWVLSAGGAHGSSIPCYTREPLLSSGCRRGSLKFEA